MCALNETFLISTILIEFSEKITLMKVSCILTVMEQYLLRILYPSFYQNIIVGIMIVARLLICFKTFTSVEKLFTTIHAKETIKE